MYICAGNLDLFYTEILRDGIESHSKVQMYLTQLVANT